MQRSARAILAVLTAALLLGGCGGGSSGGSSSTAPKKATAPNAPVGSKVTSCTDDGLEADQIRATEVDCGTARATVEQWRQRQTCTLAESDSRGSCSIGDFRCQAVKVDQGTSVSCAGPDGDVAFLIRSAG